MLASCTMGSMLANFPDLTASRLREGYFDEAPFKCREDSVCVTPLFEVLISANTKSRFLEILFIYLDYLSKNDKSYKEITKEEHVIVNLS